MRWCSLSKFLFQVGHSSEFLLPPPDPLPSLILHDLSHISTNASDIFKALSALDPTKTPGLKNISPCFLKLCAIYRHHVDPHNPLVNYTCIQSHACIGFQMIGKYTILFLFQFAREVVAQMLKLQNNISSLFSIKSLTINHVYQDHRLHQTHPFQQSVWFFAKLLMSVQLLSAFFNCNWVNIVQGPFGHCFLWLRKAFDTISHPELLCMQTFVPFHNSTSVYYFSFKAYISGRSHLVSVEGCSLDLLPVCSCVPQGSVLGSFTVSDIC